MLHIDKILTTLVERNGSDLHLKVGRPPLFRIAGDITETEWPSLTAEDVLGILRDVASPRDYRRYEEEFEMDIAYEIPGLARFRVNAFRQRRQPGGVMRAIPLQIPTPEELGLPLALKGVVERPSGLVLVTGPTGSGKSTSLASLINHINLHKPINIVTLEDPIEFVYDDAMASVNQRQVYSDINSFEDALKQVIRQDPDVILMGEMRDRESIEFGLHAAETGHLVFSTLHTNDSKQTIDRILDHFSGAAQLQVRKMLAATLIAIVSQRILKRSDRTGRCVAVELLVNSPNVRQLIEEGKYGALEKVMAQSAEYYGMQTFNMALVRLTKEGIITVERALEYSANPGDLQLLLRGITGGTATMEAVGESAPPEPEPEKGGAAALAERMKRRQEAAGGGEGPRRSAGSRSRAVDSLSDMLKKRRDDA